LPKSECASLTQISSSNHPTEPPGVNLIGRRRRRSSERPKTIVSFLAPARIADVLLRLSRLAVRHIIAEVYGLKNNPAAAATSAGFAAVQKPFPFAVQALGSGQPDQPFASDFPRYDLHE
jgi:hypothetical protein